MRAVLVGCVAGKLNEPALARDIYTSPLFVKRRRYAEASQFPWFILSAQYGLVTPDTRIWPYEATLKKPDVTAWSTKLHPGLRRYFTSGDVLEVHAGVNYVEGLRRACRWMARFGAFDLEVETPLKGLQIGEQLQWYDREARRVSARKAAETRRRRAA